MGHHGATSDLAQRLFNADDWAYMAGITDDDMQREGELHDHCDAGDSGKRDCTGGLMTRAAPIHFHIGNRGISGYNISDCCNVW